MLYFSESRSFWMNA